MTVHFRTSAWITPQLDAIRRWCGPQTTTWAVLDGIDPAWHAHFDHVIEHEGYLLVAFSGWRKQSCEVLKIKIEDLKVLDVQQ